MSHVTNTLAERLGDDGCVDQEQLGKLFITVTSVNKVQQLVEVIQGTAQGADVDIPQPQPIGELCTCHVCHRFIEN
jgi:hypothetical protein